MSQDNYSSARSMGESRRQSSGHAPKHKPVEIVRFNKVSLYYPNGHHILHELTHSVTVGSFTFLTGVSGAGKTSLLRLIYRGTKPSKGNIQVFGMDIATLSPNELLQYRRRIGVVFQDCKLFPHLNVLDNVALALKITGVSVKTARIQAKELLDWVGLGRHLYEMPHTLSDGQKQRVSIARAVITHPILLLADEPTGNLDYQAGYRLLKLFDELHRLGTTVILTTHNKGLISEFDYPEWELSQGQITRVNRTPLSQNSIHQPSQSHAPLHPGPIPPEKTPLDENSDYQKVI